MRTITNDELVSNARAAYDARILTAQHPHGHCQYEQQIGDLTCVCAVGASMTPEERKRGDALTGATVSTALYRNGIVGFEDLDFARRLQVMHDGWCQNNGPEYESEFRAIIGR